MKKLLVIAIAAFSFTAASAQNRNDNYRQDRYPADQRNDGWDNKDQRQSNDHAYGRNDDRDQRSNDRGYGRNDDRNRQAEFDRMNRQYDQRINGYRNDRSLNRYERDRRIREAEMERQQQSRSFGKGMIVGGVAAVILGAILSH